ncbi:TetR/AcrR family transcriptional regulator [Pantoea allii]|uniref:TetR/AcrR family transcriptional regulator n=1 Tax=Pantoea allii TaxID=574096 RepID=A0ABS6VGZ7_9GAMM|nr:TetR/AcrR family transcriptional regulator [Pantoea allii]MBW1215034.1 TetR/AcrR family transcriptional regulator [Pantoea allii]MBW1258599.1 TetR/AcrR family transcriptional regulator [Pantoea allii]MBW1267820.1 TetR/AcrR family transcriptional regulator [Pantoea allii]MBW1289691.1 TetR/AcrR family transcriptional regulator [Pantoea allii]
MKVDSFKEIIRKAALNLFKDKGLNSVSTRDLNSKLNISRSHMYHYYSNWDELKFDAIKGMLDDDVSDFLSKIKESKLKDSSEELLFFLDYLLPNAPSSHWILYLEIWPLSARDQRYSNLIHSNMMQWNQILEDVLSRGIENGHFSTTKHAVIARQIAAMLDGYSSMLIVDYSEEKRSAFLHELFDFSLNMLK